VARAATVGLVSFGLSGKAGSAVTTGAEADLSGSLGLWSDGGAVRVGPAAGGFSSSASGWPAPPTEKDLLWGFLLFEPILGRSLVAWCSFGESSLGESWSSSSSITTAEIVDAAVTTGAGLLARGGVGFEGSERDGRGGSDLAVGSGAGVSPSLAALRTDSFFMSSPSPSAAAAGLAPAGAGVLNFFFSMGGGEAGRAAAPVAAEAEGSGALAATGGFAKLGRTDTGGVSESAVESRGVVGFKPRAPSGFAGGTAPAGFGGSLGGRAVFGGAGFPLDLGSSTVSKNSSAKLFGKTPDNPEAFVPRHHPSLSSPVMTKTSPCNKGSHLHQNNKVNDQAGSPKIIITTAKESSSGSLVS